MLANVSNKYGTITVSPRVILEIAGNVASNCYGVVGMAARNKKDGIVSLLKSDNMNKGIDIKSADGGITIDIHIIVQYGINIATVSEGVVSRVKYSVEKMTGIKVKRITVKVEGIRVS